MSLAKNLIPLTRLPPRPVITWDKHERIRRHKEIWDRSESIVHRLPKHYQEHYWRQHVLADRAPVHYRPPEFRLYWDTKRLVQIETEHCPILTVHCPEQDKGLWGGEEVIKCYEESEPFIRKKVLPRNWVPNLYFPTIFRQVLYSEILDIYLRVVVTERALRLIDTACGLDYYLLRTPEIDFASRLALDLKRLLLIQLAKGDYYHNNEERRDYVRAKYAEFVMPLEEAEWVGLDLNTACRKQQDLEDNAQPVPLKYVYEKQLLGELGKKDVEELEDEEYAKPKPSLFGEKLFGKVFEVMGRRARLPRS